MKQREARWNERGKWFQALALLGLAPQVMDEPSRHCRVGLMRGYWGLLAMQPRNTRKTCRITYAGRTLSNWEWAEIVGIPAVPIWKRIYRGWTPERALTQPLRKHRNRP